MADSMGEKTISRAHFIGIGGAGMSGIALVLHELAARVLTLPPFRNVSQDDFRTLLLHLLEIDHIQRTDRGGLLIGLAGERVVNDYKFYAVFRENEEYTVRCDSEELGTIVKPPPRRVRRWRSCSSRAAA